MGIRPLILILILLAGGFLSASDLDLALSFGLLSPQKNVSNQTVDSYGQSTGSLFQPASDLRMVGLGAAYTFLSVGDWRFRGNAEYATSIQNPGATLRYLGSGVTTNYLEAEGTLKATSLDLGVSAVYVSSGAGEYGATFEMRNEALKFDIIQAVLSFPGQQALLTGQELKKTFTDPWLSVHATFVQHYEAFAVFTRLAFGLDLKTSGSLGSFQQASFQNLDSSLLAVVRPRQEIKLSVGARF